jgi:hemerythrin-like domain-containing protein
MVMQATELLMSEHRVIEQVLTCLEKIAANARLTHRLDGDAARQALDFFQNFADRCHHDKEEQYLFPLLEAKGFPRQGGPTGVMFHEHEEGRRHIRALNAALVLAETGHAPALQQFIEHADAYVALMREHIAKEDHCLFPMANRSLAASDQQRLLDAFQDVERDELAEGAHEHLLEIAQRLTHRYGVTAAPAPSGCACGH